MKRAPVIASVVAAALAVPATSHGGEPTTAVFVNDNFFSPVTASLREPGTVTWDWEPDLEEPHNVVARGSLFNSGDPTPVGVFELNLSAGTFPYFCTVHRLSDGMAGTVRISPAWIAEPPGPGRSFRVAWARPDTTTGDQFDVRYRLKGGRWKTWKNNTQAFQARFGARGKPVRVRKGKRYQFQVRSESSSNPNTRKSDFSPVLTVRGGQRP